MPVADLLSGLQFRPFTREGLEEPIRAELFGPERLEQHAESLAKAQRVTSAVVRGRPLLQRVEESGRILRDAHGTIAEAIRTERWITPAAEWLVDNFHIADEQLREIRDDLPASYYRELPKLAEGPLAGYPRVYGIAWAFVAHSDSRFDPEFLRRFVQAYQRVQPLTIGELWALAITIRVVLVENLRRCAEAIVVGRVGREAADTLADDLLGVGDRAVTPMATALHRFEAEPLGPAFAVQLVLRLRDRDPSVTPVLLWLHERLAVQGTTPEDIVTREHQRQAAMTVTVRNVITSMRAISAFEWSDFFENVSLVDAVLREHPNFALMDFASRDGYRHAVEELARGSAVSELDVARQAIERARGAGETAPAENSADATVDARNADPGYYLVGHGCRAFEQTLGYRPSRASRVLRCYTDAATPAYLGSIGLVSVLLLATPAVAAAGAGLSVTGLVVLILLALVPASDLAIALLNRVITTLLPPRVLSRFELRAGVPADLRTMVVIPTLLPSPAAAEELIDRLEVHYLANADGDVRFALLSDWLDAPTEHAPGDDEILNVARAGIARLNRLHGPAPEGGERFLLYHRRRQWNDRQRTWMGWERKRGKLHELNRLLRGAADTSFLSAYSTPLIAPAGVRYVITLDSDTRLPLGAVTRLIGTMAHPLNRPRLDPRSQRVIDGYGILQPRVTPPLPGRDASFFQRLSSGSSGIDPYAAAVSDVYQDLFDEGSFTGKGIYDVDAFEAAMAGRVPENALLSHDLYEGVFARTGLLTDVEFFESAPFGYAESAARQHRWTRGDWQLLPRIFRDRMPAIARWKMLDNLRRSLSAPAAFLTLVAAWAWPQSRPVVWDRFILATIALPALLPVLAGLVPRAKGISKRSHLRVVARDLVLAVWQTVLTVTMLAHQACLMADAILRTLSRVYLTHRNLLQWVTFAETRSRRRPLLADHYRRLAGTLVTVAVAAALMHWNRAGALPGVTPLLLLWALSPAVAHWISAPRPEPRASTLSAGEARSLRLIARHTWRYFTTFVGPEDRHLPPDNFQELPKPLVAHRTSPTNIGLYLLSVVTAHDFGWLGTLDSVERLEATFESIKSLEFFRGHLYNWYDTRDGRPLYPLYVSSVDSGNLAGNLIALGAACRGMLGGPLLGGVGMDGVLDAAWLLREDVRRAAGARHPPSPERRQLEHALAVLCTTEPEVPAQVPEWAARLDGLEIAARELMSLAHQVTRDEPGDGQPDLTVWASALQADIESRARDLEMVMPWARLSSGTASTVMASLVECPSLGELSGRCTAVARELTALRAAPGNAASDTVETRELESLLGIVEHSAAVAEALVTRLTHLAQTCDEMVATMDFSFLFDRTRKLFSIGYRVTEGALDTSWYDLLASEARLLSFIAIAKGEVPVAHWFRLGRPLTPSGRDSVLMSWSGSMFEYLMPALVMRTPVGSLLEQSCRLSVERQIAYGAERGVPWGVSESGYDARDVEMSYRYSGFGVPGLGLRRGLSDDVVITPYATGLAAMIDPVAAVRNFRILSQAGARGAYGFYEALDYTPSRLPTGERFAIVHSYMAHHQGMVLVAIANALGDGVMRTRFHATPMVQASELLLQERTPRDVAVARPRPEGFAAIGDVREPVTPVARRFTSPHGSTPRTHLLSNGRYTVMLTAAGSGYSQWEDLAVTRWREDVARDDAGSYIFLRDASSGECWSAGYQPRGVEPDSYEVIFREDRAEIQRRDGSMLTQLEVLVSSEDNAELRRISLTNLSSRTRDIDVTSYAEVVLAPAAADAAHPAFSNLFVSTESVPECEAVLATRRRRSLTDPEIWMAHVIAVDGATVGALQWETDRARFIGRGRTIRGARAALDGDPLSNTVGAVLDPIVSLRRRVRVRAGGTVHVCFATMVASSRDAVLDIADKYHDVTTFERVATQAWTQAQVQLHHLGIQADEADLFQNLAGSLLYTDRALRAAPDVLTRHAGGAPMLWANGISGDIPIVVVNIDDPEDVGMVRQLLRAHEYWRMKRLAVDLVILNDRAPSYVQDLQNLLVMLVRASPAAAMHDGQELRGRAFVLRADQLTVAQRDALHASARAVLSTRRGTLAEQVGRGHRAGAVLVPPLRRRSPPRPDAATPRSRPRPALEFFNGLGGFAADGREYVIALEQGATTPAPWINVIANPEFGFVVSESGAGFTWSLNSQENQLTPWTNDPVSDLPGEIFYVRDEESGVLWCPTAQPVRDDAAPYVARHGQGYSQFEHDANGIALELLQFAALDDPVKISRLTLTNHSDRPRRLSVTAYVEWVLGASRSAAAPFVITELDAATGALFARNTWSADFSHRIAFADLGGAQTSLTADRVEFLGRNGTPAHPVALERQRSLSGRVGPALDPCGAFRTVLELPAGGRTEVTFFLGQTDSRDAARDLILRYRAADLAAHLRAVKERWDGVLSAVQVRTPDRALDLMVNRWLLYQTLSCRVWARSAFYQTSGAYGFRDQLQDVMALSVARPDLAREHVLRAAARQFAEGDVQHWWHPPVGRGIRTRFSDDLLWLPYVLQQYIEVTADSGILDVEVPFLAGPLLAAGQASSYFEPGPAEQRGSLFEHCARALDRSLAVGQHDLPLMGAGDWNDGMNHVGDGGTGESVWLGWFLYTILARWVDVADARGEHDRAATWRVHMLALRVALEREGWDGAWYRRAFFDDGTPLGSQVNDECRIDSIAQSWSVISGAADPARQQQAMSELDRQLVRRDARLVLLLTPPFDHSALEPGYIKGYLPGIRENGAQYTHAATWAVIAFAMLGDGDKAAELFDLMNPISHASTPHEAEIYKIEPYVLAGDVYAEPPHVGRGGWSWYTGAAGWMYRAGLESILGFQLRGTRLIIDPCIPRTWPGFSLEFRFHTSRYDVAVENPRGLNRGVASLSLDDVAVTGGTAIPLVDDGKIHRVRVVLG